MTNNDELIIALWNSIQRERGRYSGLRAYPFGKQYFIDTLPVELQVFRAKAIEPSHSCQMRPLKMTDLTIST